MQPTSTAQSQSTVFESAPHLQTHSASQHGLEQHHADQTSRPDSSQDISQLEPADAETTERDQSNSQALDSSFRRLSDDDSYPVTPSATDRISKYENAYSPSPRKEKGVAFKVVQTGKKKNKTNTVSIEHFPNGMLGVSAHARWQLLTQTRGAGPYPIQFASINSFGN